jgi:hypothetical protein
LVTAVCFCVLNDYYADCRFRLHQIAFEERSAQKFQQMDIFEIHRHIKGDYEISIRSFVSISDHENWENTAYSLILPIA